MTHTHTPDASDLASLRNELPPNALRALDNALAGKAGGDTAVIFAPPHLKGRVAVTMHLNGAAPHTLRGAVQVAWQCAHAALIEAAGAELMPMFRAAAFPIPATLPDMVTVWRATRGIRLTEARAGIAWSLDRDFACGMLFYLKSAGVRGMPLVIRQTVPRSAIVFHYASDETGAAEVVVDAVPGGDVDGDAADWNAAIHRASNRASRGAR